jgi:steroid delta-isomerase-like uncharacterized protein
MVAAKDIHRLVAEAWNRRNFEAMRELLDPEYSYTGGDGKQHEGGPDTGIAIAQMYAVAFPDGRLEVQRVYTQGDTAIAEMTARGTHGGELMGNAPTGKAVEITICNIMELRNGKIHREREYMDMLTLMSQVGAVNLPKAAGV